MNYQNKVLEFHENFNHPHPTTPDFSDREAISKLIEQRLIYILEEVDELAQVAGTSCKDIVAKMLVHNNFKPNSEENNLLNVINVVDALVDMQYFLAGTTVALGISSDTFDSCFSAIHKNNMTKAVKEKDLAATLDFYKQQNISVRAEKNVRGNYLIIRNEDNKIMKPFGYMPVNLKDVITIDNNV